MKQSRSHLPAGQGFMHRPRIASLLAQGLAYPMLTVIAGPGYEKTRTVAAYMQGTQGRLIWLHLTPHDNDAAAFWQSLAHAAQEEMPEMADWLVKSGFPYTGVQYAAFLQRFAQEAYRGSQIILVLDDYDCLHAPDVALFLETLVKEQLENFCLVLISDQRVPISLTALKSPGGLYAISAEDLRYTPEETAAYFRMHGLDISDEEALALTKDTDGWPLPLGLIAMQQLRMGGSDRTTAGSDISLVTALLEKECFAGYVPQVRQLFIKLSLLDSFPQELVHALGRDCYDAAMEAIAGSMFIFQRPFTRQYVFQKVYHRFLADKQVTLPQEEIDRVYLLSGEWFYQNNQLDDALACFWACHAYDRYIACILALPRERTGHVRATSILAQLDAIPRDDAARALRIDFCRAFFLLGNMEVSRAQALFSALASTLEQGDMTDEAQAMAGEAYLALADISLLQNTLDFTAYYEKAHAYLPGGSTVRNETLFAVGNNDIFFLPNHEAGSLRLVTERIAAISSIAESLSHGSGYGYDLLFAAEAAFFTCDMATAAAYCYQAILKAEEHAQHDIISNAHMLQLRIALYQGEYAEAKRLLKAATDYISSRQLTALYELRDCFEGWYFILMQDLERLPDWMFTYNHAHFVQNPVETGRNRVFHTIYLMAQHKYAEAEVTMRQFERVFREKGLWTVRLTFHAMRAICAMQCGDLHAALTHLEEAYAMSHANAVLLPFAEFGNLMRTLIDHARHAKGFAFDPGWLDAVYGEATRYAGRHAAMIDAYRREQMPPKVSDSVLSRREKEVLHLLATGNTREEIGTALHISINSVKKHITGVYNKLGAINRADAIRIATLRGELG